MKKFKGYDLDKAPNDLAREILSMSNQDQDSIFNLNPDSDEIIRRNTHRLKEIVSEFGWPTIQMVGVDGARASWLLAQHSDNDLGFQKKCLSLMEECNKDEVFLENIAYLVDRIRVADERPQLYGTQFHINETGVCISREIEDKANLDNRRMKMGMGTFAEYEENHKKFMKERTEKKRV